MEKMAPPLLLEVRLLETQAGEALDAAPDPMNPSLKRSSVEAWKRLAHPSTAPVTLSQQRSHAPTLQRS